MASSSRLFSVGAVVQYVIIGVVGYILAGAPLLSLLSPSTSSSSSSSAPGSRARSRNAHRGGAVQIPKEKLEGLIIPNANLTCAEHKFEGVYVLSREPLVVYIEGFLSREEAGHVVEISEPHFTPSTVWTSGTQRLDPTVRLSEKAQPPRTNTVQCIEERAREFQGWRPYVFIEKLWAQRYGAGGHYSYHYDWGNASPTSGRVSSFMVWLGDDCEGGGTRFPRLETPLDKTWCRFIECESSEGDGQESEAKKVEEEKEEAQESGITFKPIKGNAVFWENMRVDGTGYEESWHAGLPVKSGTKIGLNIWSWYQEGYDPSAHSDASSEAKPEA